MYLVPSFYLTDKKIEDQRDESSHPRSHSYLLTKTRLECRSSSLSVYQALKDIPDELDQS